MADAQSERARHAQQVVADWFYERLRKYEKTREKWASLLPEDDWPPIFSQVSARHRLAA